MKGFEKMKKLFLMLGLVAWAGMSQAAFVCWKTAADTGFDYSLSQIVVCATADIGLRLIDDDGTETLYAEKGAGEVYASLPSDVTLDTKFKVLLLNDMKELVAESSSVTYEELASSGAIYTSILYTPDPTAYEFSEFTAVPEPTSAMMILLGLGALALKRRVIE